MLISHRRYFGILAFLLLATPLALGVVRPDPRRRYSKRGAIAPGADVSGAPADWLTLSSRIDAFLGDHFGLRQVLIRAHKDLTKPLLSAGNGSVLIGRGGRLFYLGGEAVQRSAGLVMRDHRVSDTVDLIARMKAALKARGVKFLVAVPPNAATIYADDLPEWAKNRGRRTETTSCSTGSRPVASRAVDLRPAVQAARSGGPACYMHDSHWTARGALAAFNAIVEADGRADWRLDPRRRSGRRRPAREETLRGCSGKTQPKRLRTWSCPAARTELLTRNRSAARRHLGQARSDDHDFRQFVHRGLFRPDSPAARRAGRMARIPRIRLRLENDERFHPDEVWSMPTERFLIFDPGVGPASFTG